ncbi:MAG: proline--tRNA ligase [Coriobacteriia bacterium]|nr:proline--tRNA ligase [Coriobacteriia bacterium]
MDELYAPTLKETPVEAELISHQLMLRAGMIRKTASGIYSYLPLGWRVIKKIEQIVREEMDAIGCQEVSLPVLQPAELWQESGRWPVYGPELMRLTDRHEREFCLGPTHEEIITALVRSELRSYKQLPLTLYQINLKFRDEMRPRFGLMRGREFIMKDAYSFGTDQAALDADYAAQEGAYRKICERMKMDYRIVDADSGEIGGSVSAEFMALAEAGESEIVYCECGFAADTEVCEQESCPQCGAPLQHARGIEIGQIFQLGTKYSEAMGATFQDEDGTDKPFVMGCYGIGVSRIAAALIEQKHDERGCIWPKSVAPAEVAVLALDGVGEVAETAATLAHKLAEADVEVVLDARPERPGVKFAEADLIGWPQQLIVGKRGLAAGIVEIKDRATGETHDAPLDEAVGYLVES